MREHPAVRMTAKVAETLPTRPSVLGGDAAHRFPPTGGLGLDTAFRTSTTWRGSWRSCSWRCADALLDSYQSERRPVAQADSDFSLGNFLHGGSALGPGTRARHRDARGQGPDVPAVLAQLAAYRVEP